MLKNPMCMPEFHLSPYLDLTMCRWKEKKIFCRLLQLLYKALYYTNRVSLPQKNKAFVCQSVMIIARNDDCLFK